MTQRTRNTKAVFLIRRRSSATREELIAHWFANHMPEVIKTQKEKELNGRCFAQRYVVTIFSADVGDTLPWDGVAQLWYPSFSSRDLEPHLWRPTDSFHEKAKPYQQWITSEYVIIDGSKRLDSSPLTLGSPYPMTRSGFFKITCLVASKPETDREALFKHWLDVHAPNVQDTVQAAGGFGYVISHSAEPERGPYAGMTELYFDDTQGWHAYLDKFKPDGIEHWTDSKRSAILTAHMEMVGIP